MKTEVVPYGGVQVTLQSPSSATLSQLKAAALSGGLATLTAALAPTVRAVTLVVEALATGYYRVRYIVDQARVQYEIDRIISLFDVFQAARDAIDTRGYDVDLRDKAQFDLDRALERERSRRWR